MCGAELPLGISYLVVWKLMDRESKFSVSILHDRELARTYWRLQRLREPWRHLVKQARTKCRRKKVRFDLTYQWARERWTGRCELSGLPFELGRSTAGLFSPSLDRRIPSLGYIQTNCRFILNGINAFKHTGSDAELREICRAILDANH